MNDGKIILSYMSLSNISTSMICKLLLRIDHIRPRSILSGVIYMEVCIIYLVLFFIFVSSIQGHENLFLHALLSFSSFSVPFIHEHRPSEKESKQASKRAFILSFSLFLSLGCSLLLLLLLLLFTACVFVFKEGKEKDRERRGRQRARRLQFVNSFL